jgi:alpha-D-xyloside xylohydrolase
LQLRYRLIPYIEQTMATAARTGLPAQRSMALACPNEPEASAFEDQFFFGDDLLVAPCLRPDNKVQVYLPDGDWRRFPTRERFEGGKTHRLTLRLDEFAVFARAGARVPLGQAAETTEDASSAVIEHWSA